MLQRAGRFRRMTPPRCVSTEWQQAQKPDQALEGAFLAAEPATHRQWQFPRRTQAGAELLATAGGPVPSIGIVRMGLAASLLHGLLTHIMTVEIASYWKGAEQVLQSDPLQIVYVVVHGDDELDGMSPMQGFGASWQATQWCLALLARLPGSFVERSLPTDGLVSMRMGGMAALTWLPLSARALEGIGVDDLGFAVVLLSGAKDVAPRVEGWIAAQPRPVLHLGGDAAADGVAPVDDALRLHLLSIIADHSMELAPPRREAVAAALAAWPAYAPHELDGDWPLHNATNGNEMVLARAGIAVRPSGPFVGRSEDEYDAIAVDSAERVMEVRSAAGLRVFNRLYLPRPAVFLSEPAIFRFAYARRRADPHERQSAEVMRMLQRQRGLFNPEGELVMRAMADPLAAGVLAIRQRELAMHTAAVGLAAAATCSAVLRLRPGVNHAFPALSRLARNVRAAGAEAKRKTPRLFSDAQRELAEAVGDARVGFIDRHGGPMKIVSDAPLELLPVGGLPLAIRFDVSRVSATPGNVMVAQMTTAPALVVRPEDLCRVLVISSFDEKDRLRNLVAKAVGHVMPELGGRVTVRLVRVSSEDEFVAAVNGGDEPILVFDGHGVADAGDSIGGIVIGGRAVNVWDLRHRMRSPPIVVLSACDTQGMDAPSHVTVGNGFMAAGARTVLATLLPVGGVEAAVFLSRLLLRLAMFVPAFLQARGRAVSWAEICSGMLRMVLAQEIVDVFTAPSLDPASPGSRLKSVANMDINSGRPDWHEALLGRLEGEVGLERKVVDRKAFAAMAGGQAVRYVQLGHPETIVVDDGSVAQSVLPEGVLAELEAL